MATDAKELERVRRIHAALDCARSKGCPEGATYDQLSHVLTFDGHSYTAAEVCAWPELKRQLRALLAASTYANSAYLKREGDGVLVSIDTFSSHGSYVRGLVMYREQLSDALSPGRALTEDGSVRVNEEQAEALGFSEIVKPYEAEVVRRAVESIQRHAKPRTWDADKYNGLDAATYQQLSTLDKRIAAAKAELSKPAPPRYPAEGRQDRALSVTNGMIRGRE